MAARDAEIWQNLVNPLPAVSDDNRRVAFELYTSATLARAMDAAVDAIETSPRSRGERALFHAALTVRELRTVMNSKITHDLLRTKLLAMLRLNKTLPSKLPETKRREFVHSWQDQCRLHATTQGLIAKVLTRTRRRSVRFGTAPNAKPSCSRS